MTKEEADLIITEQNKSTEEILKAVAKVKSDYHELQKENAELKKQLEMSNKVYNDNLDYSHHIEGQLTKAKEIIKDYMIIVKGGNITVCSVPEENRCINVLKLNEEAEQFLNSEVEK